MKLKKAERVAITITALCVVFTAGFLSGRAGKGNSVNVSDELKLNPAATASRSLTVNSSPVAPDNEGAKPININVADEQELASLPGIGEVIAGRIVEYRTLYGNFQVPSDIMDVAGIGPSTYEKIKDLIITEENS